MHTAMKSMIECNPLCIFELTEIMMVKTCVNLVGKVSRSSWSEMTWCELKWIDVQVAN